jgi:hypothetical protein
MSKPPLPAGTGFALQPVDEVDNGVIALTRRLSALEAGCYVAESQPLGDGPWTLASKGRRSDADPKLTRGCLDGAAVLLSTLMTSAT